MIPSIALYLIGAIVTSKLIKININEPCDYTFRVMAVVFWPILAMFFIFNAPVD